MTNTDQFVGVLTERAYAEIIQETTWHPNRWDSFPQPRPEFCIRMLGEDGLSMASDKPPPPDIELIELGWYNLRAHDLAYRCPDLDWQFWALPEERQDTIIEENAKEYLRYNIAVMVQGSVRVSEGHLAGRLMDRAEKYARALEAHESSSPRS